MTALVSRVAGAALTLLATLVVPLGAGCAEPGFLCSNDAECGGAGRCDANGFCAFEEGACASGWSYGQNATAELVGTCVPLNDAGSTGPPPAQRRRPPAPDPSGTTAADSSTGGLSTTGTSDPETGPSDAETGDDTGMEDPIATLPCDDIPLSRAALDWQSSDDGEGTTATFSDSTLLFDMELSTPSYASWSYQHEIDFADSMIAARIDGWVNETGLGESGASQVGVELVSLDGSAAARIFTTAGQIFAQVKVPLDGVQQPAQIPRSAFPIWLRIREEGGALHWEHSDDGVVFETLHVSLTPAFAANAKVAVFGGTWQALPPDFEGPSVATVGAVSACGPDPSRR